MAMGCGLVDPHGPTPEDVAVDFAQQLLLQADNARLRSALGRARGYIMTHGPNGPQKVVVLRKIEQALEPRRR